jgi:GTPase
VDATEEDVAEAYKTVRRELKAYGGEIEKKKEIVALSKCDAVDEETLLEKMEALKKACRKKPLVLSAVAGTGMKDALYALTREIVRQDDLDDAASGAVKQPWSP